MKRPSGSRIAPLTIKTAPGANYYVRLVNASSKKHGADIYIIGGETFADNIPLGRYRILYASGSTWYGERLRFGQGTYYVEADETFDFRKRGNRIQGYKIELIMQVGGNLPTYPISDKDFDN